jgi:hypothetical protein
MRNKLGSKKIAILLGAVIAIAAVLTIPFVMAAVEDQYRVLGKGVAIDPLDQVHRSAIGFVAVIDNEYDDTKEFSVSKGRLAIGHEGTPKIYNFSIGTWNGIAYNNGSHFEASGHVIDDEDNVHQLSLEGWQVGKCDRGARYIVDGELNGTNESFDLRLVMLRAKIPIETQIESVEVQVGE